MRRKRHVASHVRNVARHVRNIALLTGKYGARHSTADVWRASTVSFICSYSNPIYLNPYNKTNIRGGSSNLNTFGCPKLLRSPPTFLSSPNSLYFFILSSSSQTYHKLRLTVIYPLAKNSSEKKLDTNLLRFSEGAHDCTNWKSPRDNWSTTVKRILWKVWLEFHITLKKESAIRAKPIIKYALLSLDQILELFQLVPLR